ncbi:MAG: LysR family transcriptional regulator [Nocardia sp.]|nr:LysR family transcriptional regulator [Nocardia sp.]
MTEPPSLRIGYVPGVVVDKWARVWAERYPGSPLEWIAVPQARQRAVFDAGEVDMCFVRVPIDREGLHAIPLYQELAVVVVPADHPVALFDEVSVADLADEPMHDTADLDTIGATVQVVAAAGGAAMMPMSLARLHHRRDLVYRPVTGAASTGISLAWPIDHPDDRIEDLIGVVRGRTANSSRGRTANSSRGGTANSSRGRADRSHGASRRARKRRGR